MGKGNHSLIGAVQSHLRQGAGNVVPVRKANAPARLEERCTIVAVYNLNGIEQPDGLFVTVSDLNCATFNSPGYDQTIIKTNLAGQVGVMPSDITITACRNIIIDPISTKSCRLVASYPVSGGQLGGTATVNVRVIGRTCKTITYDGYDQTDLKTFISGNLIGVNPSSINIISCLNGGDTDAGDIIYNHPPSGINE